MSTSQKIPSPHMLYPQGMEDAAKGFTDSLIVKSLAGHCRLTHFSQAQMDAAGRFLAESLAKWVCREPFPRTGPALKRCPLRIVYTPAAPSQLGRMETSAKS